MIFPRPRFSGGPGTFFALVAWIVALAVSRTR